MKNKFNENFQREKIIIIRILLNVVSARLTLSEIIKSIQSLLT